MAVFRRKYVYLDAIKELTVHRKVKCSCRVTGSVRVKVFGPRAWLDTLPKLQEPMAVTFDWYSLRQSQKAVEQDVAQGGNSSFRPPLPPPQHLPSTRVPLLFVSERICTSKYPPAVIACNSKHESVFRNWQVIFRHERLCCLIALDDIAITCDNLKETTLLRLVRNYFLNKF